MFCDVCLQTYVPTVFENYTACLELEDQRVELSLWDTSGKSLLTAVGGSFFFPLKKKKRTKGKSTVLCYGFQFIMHERVHYSEAAGLSCGVDDH